MIMWLIIATFMLHSYNIILGTAPGSFKGLFVKVSRHHNAILGFLRRFNGSMVVYTLKAVKGLKTAYRRLKTWIIQRNAPRQGTQERNRHKLQPVRISCSPSGVMLSTLGAVRSGAQLEPTNHRNRVH